MTESAPTAPARIERQGDGYRVTGSLTFASVPALVVPVELRWAALTSPVRIDLSGVSQADSAGVALLLEWLRAARAADRELRLEGMPAQMARIAELCHVSDLLNPTEGDTDG